MHLLPLELRVLRTLRDRCPDHSWNGRRIVWCVRDYRDVIDVESVAARLADVVTAGDMPRMRDGAATFRSFCQKEKDQRAPNVTQISTRRANYDRFTTITPADASAL